VHVEREEPLHVLLHGVRGQRLPEVLVGHVAASEDENSHQFIRGATAFRMHLPTYECDDDTNKDPVHDDGVEDRPHVAPQVVSAERHSVRQGRRLINTFSTQIKATLLTAHPSSNVSLTTMKSVRITRKAGSSRAH
jgi:hypothetical protein